MTDHLDAIRDAVSGFAQRCLDTHAQLDPARIAFVYDEGSSSVFPMAVAVLPRKVEAVYRSKRASDSDDQLLWNPEEFPAYATADLMLHVDDALSDAVQAAIARDRSHFQQVRAAINRGCHVANETLLGRQCFAFAVDPELVDVRKNVQAIGNIPAAAAAEMPDWF